MRFVKNVKIASVYAVFIIDDKIMLLLNKLGNITFPGGTIERTDILKESTMYVIGLNSKSGAVCFIVNKNMPYDLIMQLQKRVHERTELDDGSLPEYLSEIKEILLLNV